MATDLDFPFSSFKYWPRFCTLEGKVDGQLHSKGKRKRTFAAQLLVSQAPFSFRFSLPCTVHSPHHHTCSLLHTFILLTLGGASAVTHEESFAYIHNPNSEPPPAHSHTTLFGAKGNEGAKKQLNRTTFCPERSFLNPRQRTTFFLLYPYSAQNARYNPKDDILRMFPPKTPVCFRRPLRCHATSSSPSFQSSFWHPKTTSPAKEHLIGHPSPTCRALS